MTRNISSEALDLVHHHINMTAKVRCPKRAAWHSRQANIWGKVADDAQDS